MLPRPSFADAAARSARVGGLLLAAGCQSIAGIADLDVGEGGAGATESATGTSATSATASGQGGAATTGATTSSGGGPTTTSTGEASSSASTSTGGPECNGGTCDAGAFCEVVQTPGGIMEGCRTCGTFPDPPAQPPECPGFCSNGCADDQCASNCDGFCPFDMFLDAKITHMRHTCEPTECGTSTITCRGPEEMNGPGPFDCHVICDGLGACEGMHLDCSGHSGRCILECRGDGCGTATITCGANSCIVCGDGTGEVTQLGENACEVLEGPGCAELGVPN